MRIKKIFIIFVLSIFLCINECKTVYAGTCHSCWGERQVPCGNDPTACTEKVCNESGGICDPSISYCVSGYPTLECHYVTVDCPNPGYCTEQICEDIPCCNEAQGDVCSPDPDPNPTTNPDPNPTTSPTAAPTGTGVISGTLHNDVDAALSGNMCTQGTSSPLTVAGATGYAYRDSVQFPFAFTTSNFTTTTYAGSGYSVTLNLAGQTGATRYICSCPAALDPANPYLCRYSDITSPSTNVNFYLQREDLSNNSWYQVFGGNFFSQTGISSAIPTACATDSNCQAAISVPKVGSTNKLASGFPIVNSTIAESIKSSLSSSFYHAYLNSTDRINNVNAYAVSTDIAPVSYDYFYKLAENSAHSIGNGEDLEPLLSDWTNSAWWSSTDINYVRIDGNVSIEETQGFNLTSSQKLVVFVDGNLTFNDSNPNDANRKITSVANGGFLAFFASGNILITPNVGYELNPSIPTVPSVTNANSNLEGVFVANDSLTIQSKTAIGEVPPDKKFIGAGTFVGWTAVNLNRTFNDGSIGAVLNNNQAIENFFYRPDLLANWPTKLKASISNWREVDPQLIAQ